MYISGPDLAFDNPLGQAFLATHKSKYGEDPLSAFHAHAYDATNMIMNAIEKVALVGDDGTIVIPRQALRDALYATSGLVGITGTLNCNENGDCADPSEANNTTRKGGFMKLHFQGTETTLSGGISTDDQGYETTYGSASMYVKF